MNGTHPGIPQVVSAFAYPDPERLAYAANAPYPHVVVEGAWDSQLLAGCKREISRFSQWGGEKDFYGARKKRYCGDMAAFPPSVRRVITEASSPDFIRWLERLTGEPGLVPDPHLEGGGIHQIVAGGFLKVHADFNWNRQLGLYRRLNVLLYLNPSWDADWGGALELWQSDLSACAKAVLPDINTMVVFTTDDQSFHGHPHPLKCPDGVARDSIALYYYSATKPAANYAKKRKSTDYRPVGADEFSGGALSRGPTPVSALKSRLRRFLRHRGS